MRSASLFIRHLSFSHQNVHLLRNAFYPSPLFSAHLRLFIFGLSSVSFPIRTLAFRNFRDWKFLHPDSNTNQKALKRVFGDVFKKKFIKTRKKFGTKTFLPYLCTRNHRKSDYPNSAEIAQLVEHNLAKVGVASSSLVFRSQERSRQSNDCRLFYCWRFATPNAFRPVFGICPRIFSPPEHPPFAICTGTPRPIRCKHTSTTRYTTGRYAPYQDSDSPMPVLRTHSHLPFHRTPFPFQKFTCHTKPQHALCKRRTS